MTHCPSSFCSSAGLALAILPERDRADASGELSRVCFWHAPDKNGVKHNNGRAQALGQRVPITRLINAIHTPPPHGVRRRLYGLRRVTLAERRDKIGSRLVFHPVISSPEGCPWPSTSWNCSSRPPSSA